MEVNVHEAKTRLSQLLLMVEQGDEVVIARAGRPIARLVPYTGPRRPRVLGQAAGDFVVPDDFNAPLPEDVLRHFTE